MKNIGVVVEDAGAARALAPVVSRLRACGPRVLGVFGAVAAGAFFGVEASASIDEVVSSCGLVVTGSSCWGERLEARAIRAARARGVPQVTFLDAWSNYVPRFSYPEDRGLGAAPDLLAAIDAHMKSGLVAAGVDAACIEVTGSPAFDPFFDSPIREVDACAPTIVFLSQPLSVLYPEATYNERVALRAVARALPAGSRLLVRAHPREDRAALAAFVSSLSQEASLSESERLETDLQRASAVVGISTMALVEAALRGCFAIAVSLGHPLGIDWRHVLAERLLFDAESEAALVMLLERAIAARGRRSPHWALARLGWSPGATDRVVAAIMARWR